MHPVINKAFVKKINWCWNRIQ